MPDESCLVGALMCYHLFICNFELKAPHQMSTPKVLLPPLHLVGEEWDVGVPCCAWCTNLPAASVM